MELGLWSTLWANCALGTTFLALPTLPVLTGEPQALPLAVADSPRHDHETQTVEVSSSDSEESEAADDSDKEAEPEPPDVQNTCSTTSDSNSVQSSVDNHGEPLTDADVSLKTKGKRKKSYQRVRYSREEYRCTMCPYTCTTERAFLRHLRSHACDTDEGSEPAATSAPSQSLAQGQSPVTEAVPRLSCPVCGKDRNGETALSKHMLRHRDNRHFCCDICVFKTVQLKKLIQHRRMHTGEKPHLCPHCSYRAARRDNLRSHVRRVHKRDNLTCDTFSPRGMLLVPSATATSASTTPE